MPDDYDYLHLVADYSREPPPGWRSMSTAPDVGRVEVLHWQGLCGRPQKQVEVGHKQPGHGWLTDHWGTLRPLAWRPLAAPTSPSVLDMTDASLCR